MGIHPIGGGEHRLLPFPANSAEGLTQRQTHFANFDSRLRHFLERWPQRQRRSVHQPKVQIGMRAVATTIDQRRFRRQIRFVDQRIHRQVRQPLGQG
ncbi:hypothetical protein D9M69_565760 [compost metagenome]